MYCVCFRMELFFNVTFMLLCLNKCSTCIVLNVEVHIYGESNSDAIVVQLCTSQPDQSLCRTFMFTFVFFYLHLHFFVIEMLWQWCSSFVLTSVHCNGIKSVA